MSTLHKSVRIGIMALLAAVLLFGVVTTAIPSQQPVAHAQTRSPRAAQNTCVSGMTPYWTPTVYDWTHPWLHHYFVQADITSPDEGTAEQNGQAFIDYTDESGNLIYVGTWTAWGTTNNFGMSEWFPLNHSGWGDSWRWSFWYPC